MLIWIWISQQLWIWCVRGDDVFTTSTWTSIEYKRQFWLLWSSFSRNKKEKTRIRMHMNVWKNSSIYIEHSLLKIFVQEQKWPEWMQLQNMNMNVNKIGKWMHFLLNFCLKWNRLDANEYHIRCALNDACIIRFGCRKLAHCFPRIWKRYCSRLLYNGMSTEHLSFIRFKFIADGE